MSQSKQKMQTLFSLAQPVPCTSQIQQNRRRFPHSGPQVANPMTVELQKIKVSLTLTTKEFVKALFDNDGISTSPETLQAYLQGYIASDELIENMLLRVRSLHAAQSPVAKEFSVMTMVEIMNSWLEKLDIDPQSSGCPWRKLSKITGKDHSIFFRWYQSDRKPQSITTLINIENIISEFARNHPSRAKAAS